MADYKHSELLQDLGNEAAEFGKSVANKAANFVCALYAQYPAALMPPGGSAFARGVWNNLCSGRGTALPVPPPVSFTGGQCDGVPYDVEYRISSASEPFRDHTAASAHYGPIGGGRALVTEQYPNYFNALFQVLSRGRLNVGLKPAQDWEQVGFQPGAPSDMKLRVTKVTRTDGQPDNCGNLGSSDPNTPLPPGAGSGSITGTYQDGGVYVIPVVLKPSVDVNVNVDVGGVTLKFDAGGVTFGNGSDVSGSLSDILDAVNEGVAQIIDGQCACADIPDENSYDTDIVPDEDGTTKDGIQGLEWVRVEITQSPTNAKSQYGNGASDVYYAGWLSFVANGASLPREPIHFKDAIFRAPDGSTGYEYCLYTGYRGSATEYKRPPTAPVV